MHILGEFLVMVLMGGGAISLMKLFRSSEYDRYKKQHPGHWFAFALAILTTLLSGDTRG